MKTHRWVAGAVVLCMLGGCKHWDWSQPPTKVPETDDCKMHSVGESLEFYATFLPPRGFYQVFLIPEVADEKSDQQMLPYSFVIVRVRDARHPERTEPLIERIIGPVRGKEEWTDLFSILRRYASSPPAGFYCWQNDCQGKYSPGGDPDPRDPYPPDMPDHAAIAGPSGLVNTPVPSTTVSLLRDSARNRGMGGSGFDAQGANGGGQCAFTPRDNTVLTGGIVEALRASSRGVGRAVDDVPSIPVQTYPKGYPQPPYEGGPGYPSVGKPADAGTSTGVETPTREK